MTFSWHKFNWFVKGIYSLMPCGIVSWVLQARWPNTVGLAVECAVVWSVVVVGTLAALFVSAAHHFGRLGFACPMCGGPSKVIPLHKQSYLRCPKCGNVYATGFFRPRYIVTRGRN